MNKKIDYEIKMSLSYIHSMPYYATKGHWSLGCIVNKKGCLSVTGRNIPEILKKMKYLVHYQLISSQLRKKKGTPYVYKADQRARTIAYERLEKVTTPQ